MARKARSVAPAPASPQASSKSKTEPPASSSRPRTVSSKPTSDPSTSSPTAFISLFPLLQILVLGALVRLVLFTRLPKTILDVLVDRNELSSPLTSWRRLKEGVFLLGKGVNPYDGGLVLLSPLQLHLSAAALPPTSDGLTALVWTLADVGSAFALSQLWNARVRSGLESPVGRKNWSSVVTFLYLFNPYTLLTTLARSTTTFENALVLFSLAFGSISYTSTSLFLLALATRTSLYPILLLPALILFIPPTPNRSLTQRSVRQAVLFLSFVSGLATVERGLAGSWEAVFKGWRVILAINDLTPNVGLSWYFFTEMFEHFRTFFVFVFQAHLVIYVIPFCLTFKADPLYAILCQLWIISTLQTYPTLGSTSLSVSLLPLFPSLIPHIARPLIPIGLHVYSSLLFPILHHLWLHAGSANANFFYAAGLVAGLGNVISGVEVVWVGRKRQFERSEGVKEGWKVVQVTD